jgi:hypothetical protein
VRNAALALAAAALFGACWLIAYPDLPLLPNGDVYTSLGVARHLAEGRGLLNDTVYPLFTAYEWGQTMPQPLIHRPPGLAALLLPAYLAAGGDPVVTESLVRPLFLAFLAGAVFVGVLALARRDRLHTAPALLILLMVNPLLALGVRWGWGEIPAALLLMILWLMVRRRAPSRFSLVATLVFSVLCGMVALIRSDLLWVPVLWWVVTGLVARRRHWPALLGRTAVAAVAGVAVLLPWWLHVIHHAGSPLANPLTDAVQLDMREEWYDYPRLRGRDPIPLGENVQHNLGPALHKVASGVRSYVRTLGLWLPWYFWLTVLPLWAVAALQRTARGHPPLRSLGPPGLMWLTVALMVLQYAFFSPETRHLLPILPIVAWEGVLLADRWLQRPRDRRLRAAALAGLATAAVLLSPPNLGGEAGNVLTARALTGDVAAAAASARDLPPGPVFTDSAAVPWRLGRPAVWSPYDAGIEAEIRAAVPAMADAPWVRLPAISGGDIRDPSELWKIWPDTTRIAEPAPGDSGR